MQISRLFGDFFKSESAGGLILIACTVISLLLANSAFGHTYEHFWHLKIGNLSIAHWINDLLMAIFFLLVGLEIEREIYVGELKEPGKALFPVFGAVGGMLIPAGLYFFININEPNQSGFGIPMATDIAFALGMVTLLGKRVPTSLKVFLAALAIIDDLGAIIVIAIFYTSEINWVYLCMAALVYIVLLFLNKFNVKRVFPYAVLGLVMWYFMLQSGVHATLAGVLLAFAIPFRDGKKNSPSYKMQHALHLPVAFVILPLFALANTAIFINPEIISSVTGNHALGIILGLVLGKPLGIVLLTLLAVKMKFANLPEGVTWMHVTGAGILAGIGFTMSIFISMLAYTDDQIIASSKFAILIASTVAAVSGLLWLYLATKNNVEVTDEIIEEK